MTEQELQAWIQKYTPTEVQKLKNEIEMSRFTYIIKDPYPQITDWEYEQSLLGFLGKRFSRPKPEISVHKAYKDGQDFMWGLIKKVLDKY